jgi:hypothetical protein
MSQSTTVKEVLQEYYSSHFFGEDAFTSKWAWLKVGSLKIPFPNLKQRREAIHLHDLTHILTGYDTTWTGEGEVAAWEIASGFTRHYWIGWLYAPVTFTVGCFIAPRRVAQAFRCGIGKKNLYQLRLNRDQLEQMTLGDLKALLQ